MDQLIFYLQQKADNLNIRAKMQSNQFKTIPSSQHKTIVEEMLYLFEQSYKTAKEYSKGIN